VTFAILPPSCLRGKPTGNGCAVSSCGLTRIKGSARSVLKPARKRRARHLWRGPAEAMGRPSQGPWGARRRSCIGHWGDGSRWGGRFRALDFGEASATEFLGRTRGNTSATIRQIADVIAAFIAFPFRGWRDDTIPFGLAVARTKRFALPPRFDCRHAYIRAQRTTHTSLGA